ncbi:hypothetical protein OA107_00990 [Candidatus Pelagibacter sp.]|nr:hypothetical protein [Candidatus Pelagibacter sp.]
MSIRTIKDPTFNIYAKGGNVENKSKAIRKEQLLQLAKDEADLKFDFESAITDKIIRDFEKERSSGQSLSDWLNTKPREYFLNIPLELSDGGKVIMLSDYLKQKEKPKIKKINLAQGDFSRAVADLTDADKLVIKELLRKSGINVGRDD